MRILFASAVPFDASHRGGAQESTRDLARALVARGIECLVLGRLYRQDSLPFDVADKDGVDQLCAVDPAELLPVVLERFRPDAAIVSCGDVRPLLDVCAARALPTVVYFRDVEFGTIDWRIPTWPPRRHVANSTFVERAVRAALGVSCDMVPSLVQCERYAVTSTRERVLFVNPIPKKGLHIALALARALPSVPFTFVEGGTAPPAEHAALVRACAEPGNVELAPPADDMREHYRRARVLLVPSVWEESSARVVTEAQVSGIPVLASRRGGLPESVGAGGIVEDPFGPIEHWVEHLAALWHDDGRYQALAEAARRHASRPEIAEETIARRVLAIVAESIAADGRRPPAPPPTRQAVGIAAAGAASGASRSAALAIDLGRTGPATSPVPGLPRDSLQPIDGVWTIVGGFDGPEGPFPDLGLDTRFRWIVGQPATLLLFSAVGGPRTVALVVRSMVRHQRLQISIDGGSPHRRRLRGIFPRAETLTVTHEFTRGPCRVEIGIDRWTETVEGRRLGAVLDSVEFAPGPPRRGFWALGFVRAT